MMDRERIDHLVLRDMELVFVVVEDDIEHYLNLFLVAKRNRRPRTREWYENVLRFYREATVHLRPSWPPTVQHLDAFLATFDDKNLSEASRSNYFRALRSFLNWCEKRGHLQDNPIRYVDAPEPPKRLPKFIPEQDIEALCKLLVKSAPESWQNTRDLCVFSLAFDAGARIGELANLTVSDVDLMHQQLHIRSSKDHEDRILVLGEAAASTLAMWLAKRIELDIPSELRCLFVSHHRRKTIGPLTHWGMRQRINLWQKRAGVKHFNFHLLRHSYAIYSLRNKADLLDIRDQMGHASIATTAKYTQVVNEGRNERHQRSSPLNNLTKGGSFDKLYPQDTLR